MVDYSAVPLPPPTLKQVRGVKFNLIYTAPAKQPRVYSTVWEQTQTASIDDLGNPPNNTWDPDFSTPVTLNARLWGATNWQGWRFRMEPPIQPGTLVLTTP